MCANGAEHTGQSMGVGPFGNTKSPYKSPPARQSANLHAMQPVNFSGASEHGRNWANGRGVGG